MFKSLIAAIALACAAVASVSAHADTSLPFVDPLIGSWCSVVGYGFNNKNATFKRGPDSCAGNVTVNHDYYSGVDGSCTFFNVKRIGRGHYVTHADCHRGSYMKAEFKVVGKTMHFKELAYHWSLNGFSANADPAVPSTCGFTAYDIPDGFLNLRAGPGTQYIVKATVPPGYDLKIEESIDGWMHVTVPHLHVNDGYDGYDMLGWVKGKFVKSIECPDIPPDQEPKQDIPPDREPLPVVTPPCALPTIGNPEGKC